MKDRCKRMEGGDSHWRSVAERMANEDEPAVTEFVSHFAPCLRAFFIRKGFGITDAEDLVAITIARAVARIRLYRPYDGATFSGWVHTIAWRVRADWLRERGPTETLTDDLPAAELPHPEATGPDLALVQAVEEAILKLSAKAQGIIRCRYLGGHESFAEIGRELGLSEGAARVQHLRALDKLAKILSDDPRLRSRRPMEKRKIQPNET